MKTLTVIDSTHGDELADSQTRMVIGLAAAELAGIDEDAAPPAPPAPPRRTPKGTPFKP